MYYTQNTDVLNVVDFASNRLLNNLQLKIAPMHDDIFTPKNFKKIIKKAQTTELRKLLMGFWFTGMHAHFNTAYHDFSNMRRTQTFKFIEFVVKLNGSTKSNTKVLNAQKPRFVTAESMSMIERISKLNVLQIKVDAQTSKV